jgi:hypothetical protein
MKRLENKMRKRWLREALSRYIAFYKRSNQLQRNRSGAEYMREVLQLRQKKKFFDSICQLNERDKRAKAYWLRILNKMDAFMKMRALKRWNENGHLKKQFELNQLQLETIALIEKRNAEICEFENGSL